jgi:hydrogenase maturation protein HypF
VTVVAVADIRRIHVRVRGTVQGVGFRPFVWRLATELGVSGHVLNDTQGVVIEAEGDDATLGRFLERVASDAPPLALVESVDSVDVDLTGESGFAIAHSRATGPIRAPVPADAATCADCLAELADPADRRYRYPFINCTNCGPRFTIVRGIPYDRPQTTMAGFTMCADCQAEYDDPADRRFHAQPNACPACGPRLRLADSQHGDPLGAAVAALLAGRVVAVKGLGGYHLACRADDENAVATMRGRKHREDKPFAVMVADLAAARALCDCTPLDEELLDSAERPIVLIARRPDARVAASVAPGRAELGLMLAYSPLHHLLTVETGLPLVMTSGNVSDEPIAFCDDDALARLRPIADLVLLHDRPIETRTDDSVVRVLRSTPPRAQILRRSRGHVPRSIALPVRAPQPLLAVGAELKNTFCLAAGDRAWVSHHIGDLTNYETLRSFAGGIDHFERLLELVPEVVAHDLHPEYLSTKRAQERDGVRLIGVQHHHAHLAACLAEHGELGPAVGAIFDGAGLGSDGTVWGGEILHGDLIAFDRVDHLWPVRLPGGDAAARQPWRMACAWLTAAGGPGPALPRQLTGSVSERAWAQVARLAEGGLASPVTSSVGRLFDAVAALCGLRTVVTYEGQAAIELEAACAPGEHGAYDAPGLDLRPVISAVATDLQRGVAVGPVAARFHATVAEVTARACAGAASARGVELVVLAGGVFQNRRLLEATMRRLGELGLRVLVPERLPPNDGGIAYGQAAIAAATLAGEERGVDVRPR